MQTIKALTTLAGPILLMLIGKAFADQRCTDNAIDGGSMHSDNPADAAMCR